MMSRKKKADEKAQRIFSNLLTLLARKEYSVAEIPALGEAVEYLREQVKDYRPDDDQSC